MRLGKFKPDFPKFSIKIQTQENLYLQWLLDFWLLQLSSCESASFHFYNRAENGVMGVRQGKMPQCLFFLLRSSHFYCIIASVIVASLQLISGVFKKLTLRIIANVLIVFIGSRFSEIFTLSFWKSSLGYPFLYVLVVS